MNMKREADIIEGIRLAEAEFDRHRSYECEWAEENDRKLFYTDQRSVKRQEELDSIVPHRTCESCSKRHLDSRSWVVIKQTAICRSCFFRRLIKERTSLLVHKPKGKLFGKEVVIVRYPLNGEELIKQRKAFKLSSYEFARLAGWSRSYQRKLEGETVSISKDTKEVIETVLREAGVEHAK